ncbi:UrcA family protein [Qipengyuania aquimaris]|uniref:UrcA family protein n=1 Tax=Qipengyuania aquimaris TaxID=255984 RepID=UPI001C9599FA|nr:UrcA family protein [Qipengyuania aquimaris]MBY6128663.1 UrcA family protein [Qipengyuania aquimaris]
MKKTFVLATAAFAAIATPAMAKDAPDTSVAIGDLDLTKQADQDKLDNRIDNAVRRMCRVEGFDLQARKLERSCRLAAEANAAPQIEVAIAGAREERFAAIELDVQG